MNVSVETAPYANLPTKWEPIYTQIYLRITFSLAEERDILISTA